VKRAFSLLEVMVSMAILSLALLVCFQLFEWGSRAAVLGQARAGLEGESGRILLAIRGDLQRSDYSGLETLTDSTRSVTNPEGQLVERHALCTLGLKNWNDPASIDPVAAAPKWDRYVVLYATKSTPGSLVKQTYSVITVGPMGTLDARVQDNPALNGALSTQILGQNVEIFRLTQDETAKSLKVDLTLSTRGGRKGGSGRINERFQVSFQTRLENSLSP